ncbi:MAG: CoA pyrophosphatase [Anaerolineaceae bacterium]|nr:CoA pyrophosphatase [Anaerolineaceae bacterium]
MLSADWGTFSEEEIKHRLRRQPGENPPSLEGFRSAAVLVPLLWEEDGWHLLFTRRTETVQSHKGQVSFPGGTAEPGDITPEDTALREAYEEIGLLPRDATIFGRLDHLATVSNFLITPILARIPWPYPFHLSAEEVSHIFTIPLTWLADSSHWEERPRHLPSGKLENVVHYQPYGGETLWGISARITLELLETLHRPG